jgi:CPA1 family monovalent cation:H+ antiporter
LFWGGLRGSLAIALVLSVPATLPFRQELLIATFGVVAFSVFVQGWTITPLMRYLGQLTRKQAAASRGSTTVIK